MSSEMKETIKEFKQQNGNISFTNKDLIMYLVTKVDKIEETLLTGAGKIAENRARVDTIILGFKVGIPILVVVLSGLFGLYLT